MVPPTSLSEVRGYLVPGRPAAQSEAAAVREWRTNHYAAGEASSCSLAIITQIMNSFSFLPLTSPISFHPLLFLLVLSLCFLLLCLIVSVFVFLSAPGGE